MSNPKGGLGGLFVNKKASAAPASANPAAQPKDVKKRWMMIGIGMVGFIVMASSFFGQKKAPVVAAPKEAAAVNVNPNNVSQKDWISQAGERLKKAENENAELKATQARLLESVEILTKAEKERGNARPVVLPPNVVAPPLPNGQAPVTQTPVNAPPAPPTLPPSVPVSGKAPSLALPPAMGVEMPGMPVGSSEPRIFKPEAKAPVASTSSEADVVKAKIKYTKNPYSGFLPAGAFAPVSLLNGLDAGTSQSTQANPLPVLMTITDHASLPGNAKYSIKSCFVLGTGYGDLSAERVYVRYSRMTCVDKRDRLVLSADVTGYLVDSDGKIGLRGKVVDRQGAKLGKAVLAGFAQGLSGAFGQAQGVMTSSPLGATTSIGGDAAIRAAGLNGAQSAAQQLAQFYLKEAQAIFPVITIDAGRNGTIVFTDNASLTWSAGDAQFVKEVKPTNN
jgi:conjugal transfer pilus assembly protein TraB